MGCKECKGQWPDRIGALDTIEVNRDQLMGKFRGEMEWKKEKKKEKEKNKNKKKNKNNSEISKRQRKREGTKLKRGKI